MDYDHCNRLIAVNETDLNGITRKTTHTYDTLGQRKSTTDPFDQTTTYKYDPFGHVLEASHSLSTVAKTYDTLGHLASSTDPNGNTTLYTHNPLGKPTLIQYPDGTHEEFTYNLDGTLESHTDKGGTKTQYTYDFLSRIKSKTTPLTHETFIYDAFHLISKTDAEGNVTTYEYDPAGRKTAQKIGSERIEYFYDSMGRLYRVQKGDLISITDYDLLDRVIEEREEDPSGNVLRKTHHDYSLDGSEYTVIRYINGQESKEVIFYDAFGRQTAHVDASGHVSRCDYNDRFINPQGQTVLQTVETDPLGTQTITTHDTLGRTASLEKKNAFGESLYLEELSYDPSSNLKHQLVTIPARKTAFRWEYDSMNRMKVQIEAEDSPEQRTTSYTFDARGLLHQVYKPGRVDALRSQR